MRTWLRTAVEPADGTALALQQPAQHRRNLAGQSPDCPTMAITAAVAGTYHFSDWQALTCCQSLYR
ncbi:hypothetical protein AVEN_107873-1, partial [Araneus ventricosus]